jgi:hypothetical protein
MSGYVLGADVGSAQAHLPGDSCALEWIAHGMCFTHENGPLRPQIRASALSCAP